MTGLRQALRQLSRAPAFSATVVSTLALAIGANALIFSVIEGVLLTPLPYPDASRIVRVFETDARGIRSRPSDPNFEDLRTGSGSFEAFAQYGTLVESVTGGSEAARVAAALVSREFFAVLGVEPIMGRTFLPEESQLGGPPAALVSYGYWRRYLQATPDLASRTLRLHERAHTVIGVLPPGFDFPEGADVWTPSELWPVVDSRTAHNYEAIGRLAIGTPLEAARRELGTIARRLAVEHGDDTTMADVSVVPLHEYLVGDARAALLVLMAAVALLFAAACVNVLSLLLARAIARGRELQIRVALGASLWRLTRQFFTEAFVLCAAGAGVGSALAWLGLDLLVAVEAERLPRAETIAFDWVTAVFVVSLTLLTAAGLSLLMAWRASRERASLQPRERAPAGGGRSGLRDALMSAQVAIALVLMIGAALLARSFALLADVEPGFRTSGITFMNLAHPESADRADRRRLVEFDAELMRRLAALPGTESVGGITAPPLLAGSGWNGSFVIQNRLDEVSSFEEFAELAADPARVGRAELRIATEGYFDVLGIPLLRGRAFEPSDGPNARHVALVSRALADRTWPGEDPLGKLVQFGNMDGDLTPLSVVGVVGDVRERGLDAESRPTIYAYYRQRPNSLANFWIAMRTPDAALVVPAAREIARAMDPDLVPEFRTAEQLFAATLAERRFNLILLSLFGATALLLALAGVYGSMSFNVAQRTREVAIRLALGARRGRVLALVLGRALRFTTLGIAIGIVVALASTRLVASLLYGVPPHDPIAYAAVALAILSTVAFAAWLPARRVAGVDPMLALRHD